MKIKIVIAIACLALFTGCGGDAAASSGGGEAQAQGAVAETVPADGGQAQTQEEEAVDVEITDKMFIAQTNEIWNNASDYFGKTIKYEGVFDSYDVPETNQTFYSVIRFGPGCCGTDGNVGFEVKWDKEYPQPNDWVEAVGKLEEYEEDGYKYLRLNLSSLTVLPERGEETVVQ